MRIIILLVLGVFAALVSCGRKSSGIISREDLSVEDRLEKMRSDTVWIQHLDSLAGVFIGEGSVCIDAVKHLFSYRDRKWIFNPDWGGVIEIPDGYMPKDDRWQAVVSFHGTTAISPDSLALVSCYGGFQSAEDEDYREFLANSFTEDNLDVISLTEEEIAFGEGTAISTFVEAVNNYGIRVFSKYIWSTPDHVEFCARVQFPSEWDGNPGELLRMLNNFPTGPSGACPHGECL